MSAQHTPELIQRARDIAADVFIEREKSRGKTDSFDTFAKWGEHIDNYSRFMREGAYDGDLAVQSALRALETSRDNVL